MVDNLYVHFPFCRRKCSYCALYSRAGVSPDERDAYVRRLANEIGSLRPIRSLESTGSLGSSGSLGQSASNANVTLSVPNKTLIDSKLRTVYFGGGSPALCDLSALAPALRPLCDEETEFTVELHPLDVTAAKLDELKALGVNRISMGVQSLNDATLAAMGRGYTVDEAERAFALVKGRFDNAGIDLIVGYPGDEVWNLQRLESWGLKHCSVYSLQNERGLKDVPADDIVLDGLGNIAIFIKTMGLERYEISNYAVPGYECRHNLAVWRGEDYLGLGDGACGRIGLKRTIGRRDGYGESTVEPEFDAKERLLFRLRTREGLDVSGLRSGEGAASPDVADVLAHYVREGLLVREGQVYRLTERGTEVCDSILADLV